MRGELDRMHKLIRSLEKLSSTGRDVTAVKALVTEYAANILFAYRDFTNALDAISRPK
jgi:hypothetical protein